MKTYSKSQMTIAYSKHKQTTQEKTYIVKYLYEKNSLKPKSPFYDLVNWKGEGSKTTATANIERLCTQHYSNK